MAIKEYTEQIEDLFIQFLWSDPETFVRVRNIISPKFFEDPDNRKIIEFLMEYTEEHTSLPTHEQLKAVTGKEVEKISEINDEHVDWFMAEFERFCQQKAAKDAVYKSIDLINDNNLGEVVEKIKSAAELGIVKDLGVDYFEDPSKRLEEMRDRSNMISTGWKTIDNKLYGGLEKGTITIYAGQCVTGDTKVTVIEVPKLDRYFNQQ